MDIKNEVFTTAPTEGRQSQELAIYAKLAELEIPHLRVDHDKADTMEDCIAIEKVLGAPVCKNLFLCNRQQTEFYLLLMPGDKPFKTKFLSAQLGCARLSFAGEEHMAGLLDTIPGSVSALELLFDTDKRIKLVLDRDLEHWETVGCHPGFSTSTVKLTLADLLRYAAAVGHEPTWVDLPDPRNEEA